MKKKILVVCSILLVLCIMTGTLHAVIVFCHDIPGCRGSTGCDSAKITGCTLECIGGAEIFCIDDL